MWTRLTVLISTAMLCACASIATDLPSVNEPALRLEVLEQEQRALSVRSDQQARLLRVARPILLANAELCPRTRHDIGVMFHSESNYDKEMRLAARRELGAGEDPRVFKVAPNSPAARAGLRVGDTLRIDGKVAGGKAVRRLTDAGSDPVTLDAQSEGADARSVTLTPERVCDYRLSLDASASINAFANGRAITVTTGLMEFVENDDELALIIGHELAHNTMSHIRKSIGNYILSMGGTRYTRPFESEADYVGLYYMVRAGYDPSGVEDFWRRMAEINPRSVNRAKTHPTFPDRYVRLAAARAEIEAKQAAGEPLLPNFKDGSSGE